MTRYLTLDTLVPDMTYNVFGGTLNLTLSINQSSRHNAGGKSAKVGHEIRVIARSDNVDSAYGCSQISFYNDFYFLLLRNHRT